MTAHVHNDQTCVDFLDRIVYLIDNELDETEMVAVQVHLEECSPCLEKYNLQKTVKQIVARSCCESAPEALRQRVRVQIQEIRIQLSE